MTILDYRWFKRSPGTLHSTLIVSDLTFRTLGEVLVILNTTKIPDDSIECVVFFCEGSEGRSEFSLSGTIQVQRAQSKRRSLAGASTRCPKYERTDRIKGTALNPEEPHEGDEDVTLLCRPSSNLRNPTWKVARPKINNTVKYQVLYENNALNWKYLRDRVTVNIPRVALTLKKPTMKDVNGGHNFTLRFWCCPDRADGISGCRRAKFLRVNGKDWFLCSDTRSREWPSASPTICNVHKCKRILRVGAPASP